MAHGRDPVGSDVSELREERHFLLLSLLDLDAERDAGDIDNESYVTCATPTSRSGRNPAASRRSRVAGRGSGVRPVAGSALERLTRHRSPRTIPTEKLGRSSWSPRSPFSRSSPRRRARGRSSTARAAECLVLHRNQKPTASCSTAANNGKGKCIIRALKAYQAILKGDPANPQAAADMGSPHRYNGKQSFVRSHGTAATTRQASSRPVRGAG